MILDEEQKGSTTKLIDLYVFADKMEVIGFQNTIIEVIRVQLKNPDLPIPSLHTVRQVFENTTQHSPFRQLLVDFYAYDIPAGVYTAHPDDWPPIFLAHVAAAMGRRWNSGAGPAEIAPYDDSAAKYQLADSALEQLA